MDKTTKTKLTPYERADVKDQLRFILGVSGLVILCLPWAILSMMITAGTHIGMGAVVAARRIEDKLYNRGR